MNKVKLLIIFILLPLKLDAGIPPEQLKDLNVWIKNDHKHLYPIYGAIYDEGHITENIGEIFQEGKLQRLINNLFKRISPWQYLPSRLGNSPSPFLNPHSLGKIIGTLELIREDMIVARKN